MAQQTYRLHIVSGESDEAILKESIADILRQVPLCTFATTTPDGAPHITNTFCAYTPSLQIVTLTAPSSNHGKNVATNPRVEMSITNTVQLPTGKKQGLELVGTMRRTTGLEALKAFRAYMRRYMDDFKKGGNRPSLSRMMHSRPYIVDVNLVKVLDETRLENDVMYIAEVQR